MPSNWQLGDCESSGGFVTVPGFQRRFRDWGQRCPEGAAGCTPSEGLSLPSKPRVTSIPGPTVGTFFGTVRLNPSVSRKSVRGSKKRSVSYVVLPLQQSPFASPRFNIFGRNIEIWLVLNCLHRNLRLHKGPCGSKPFAGSLAALPTASSFICFAAIYDKCARTIHQGAAEVLLACTK